MDLMYLDIAKTGNKDGRYYNININYDKVFQKNPLKFFRTKKYLYLYDKEKDC